MILQKKNSHKKNVQKNSQGTGPYLHLLHINEGNPGVVGDAVRAFIVESEVVGVPGEDQDRVHVHLLGVPGPGEIFFLSFLRLKN